MLRSAARAWRGGNRLQLLGVMTWGIAGISEQVAEGVWLVVEGVQVGLV